MKEKGWIKLYTTLSTLATTLDVGCFGKGKTKFEGSSHFVGQQGTHCKK